MHRLSSELGLAGSFVRIFSCGPTGPSWIAYAVLEQARMPSFLQVVSTHRSGACLGGQLFTGHAHSLHFAFLANRLQLSALLLATVDRALSSPHTLTTVLQVVMDESMSTLPACQTTFQKGVQDKLHGYPIMHAHIFFMGNGCGIPDRVAQK